MGAANSRSVVNHFPAAVSLSWRRAGESSPANLCIVVAIVKKKRRPSNACSILRLAPSSSRSYKFTRLEPLRTRDWPQRCVLERIGRTSSY